MINEFALDRRLLPGDLHLLISTPTCKTARILPLLFPPYFPLIALLFNCISHLTAVLYFVSMFYCHSSAVVAC